MLDADMHPGVFGAKKALEGKTKRPPLLLLVLVFLFLALILSLGAGYYYYVNYKRVATATEDTNTIVKEVGEYIVLPVDVIPKIGKIANTEEFKLDPFLSQAEIDDIVLFYPYHERTVKAILWRPKIKKIVDVSLVTLPQPLK